MSTFGRNANACYPMPLLVLNSSKTIHLHCRKQLAFSNKQTGYYLIDHAQYEQAKPLYERALAIRGQVLGPNHPDTAHSLNNLAALYNNQGDYEQAKPLYERALAIREQVLGPNHPNTASSLNNLAAFYKSQGDYEQAKPLYEHALAIIEKTFGSNHPNTKIVRENLATLLVDMKKTKK